MLRALLLSAALFCALGTSAEAQVKQKFEAGSPIKLRWTTAGSEMVQGELVAVDQDGITFRAADAQGSAYRSARSGVLRAKFDQVDVLWVDLGKSRAHAAWRGALWGAYVLAGAGAVAGPLIAPEIGYGAGQTSAMLGAGGGLAGAALGAVVGAIFAPEHRWKSYRFKLR